MSKDLIVYPELNPLISSSFNKELPLPFVKEILLLECHIAGTNYQNLDDIEENFIIGEEFILKRESENIHDNKAISIYNKSNVKLGYIPKIKNEILSRLMDAGKFIYAKLHSKEKNDNWLNLNIEVYLKEI